MVIYEVVVVLFDDLFDATFAVQKLCKRFLGIRRMKEKPLDGGSEGVVKTIFLLDTEPVPRNKHQITQSSVRIFTVMKLANLAN